MTGDAGGSGAMGEAAEDAERFGLPPEIAGRLKDVSAGAEDRGVWSENAEAVAAFALASTQWRVAGCMAGLVFIGLDYASAAIVIAAAGMTATPDLWSDIRVMEAEALLVLNEG